MVTGDLSELDKLESYLIEHAIPYEREDRDFRQECGYIVDCGLHQIRCDGWDAICHYGSYGYEKGLLEIMGGLVSDDQAIVEGWLTADEIIARLEADQ